MKNTVKVHSASKIGIVSLLATIIFVGAILIFTGCPTEGSSSSSGGVINNNYIELDAKVSPGETMATTIKNKSQYTGSVQWSNQPSDNKFVAGQTYTATITLTASNKWTFPSPLATDFFTIITGNGAMRTGTASGSSSTVTVTATFNVGASEAEILVLDKPYSDPDRQILTNLNFKTASSGYTSENEAIEVYVYNASTGTLAVTLGITNGNNFTVSPTSVTLSAGESSLVKVQPVANLAAGSNYLGALKITSNPAVNLPADISLKIRVTGTRYIITQDTTNSFSYKVSGGNITTPVLGSITAVLEAIKGDGLRGTGAVIQFGADIDGDGKVDEVVNFSSDVDFRDSSWGTIEIQGNIFSSNNSGDTGAVYVGDGVTLTSFANIESVGGGNSSVIYIDPNATAVNIEGGELIASRQGRVVYNGGSATVTVSGSGAVKALVNDAIMNEGDGEVVVDGGTVSTTTGRAILNSSTGKVTVKNGGLVRATVNNGVAIRNTSSGGIFVEGGTVTSQNTVADQGTITIVDYVVDEDTLESEGVDTLLTVSGGTVENTISNGKAIYNKTPGRVVIEGDSHVAALFINGTAIYNQNTGPLDIKGGTVEVAEGTGAAVTNYQNGVITISGGLVKATTARAIWSQGAAKPTIAEEEDFNVVITVTGGHITSANPLDTQGTIHIQDIWSHSITGQGVDTAENEFIRLEISGEDARIENTSPLNGNVIANYTKDNVIVKAGTIAAKGGYAIDNTAAESRVKISGGTVSTEGGRAVNNRAKVSNWGTSASPIYQYSVEISGGTVSAKDGIAVYNVTDGRILIKGNDAVVTSENTKSSEGTIFIEDYSFTGTTSTATNIYPDRWLLIQGGEVNNSYSGNTGGNAIYNASKGWVTITGFDATDVEEADEEGAVESYPRVWATTGSAVFNNKAGYLEILKGATVEVDSGIAVNNITGSAPGVGPFPYISAAPIVLISDVAPEDSDIKDEDYFAAEHRTVVKAVSGKAVFTGGTASGSYPVCNVKIEGGLVETDSGYAVDKSGDSAVVLITTKVGTDENTPRVKILANSGIAINSATIGSVILAGRPLVTSQHKSVNGGTVTIADNGGTSEVRFLIMGGKVENNGGGVAIYNRSVGRVYVTGNIMADGFKAEVISNNASATQGTIVLGKLSTGSGSYPLILQNSSRVYNGAVGGNAIYNASIGQVWIGWGGGNLVTISDDEEDADDPFVSGIWVHADQEGGIAVYNADNGIIQIDGGTIEATGPKSCTAVYNAAGSGAVNITGLADITAEYGEGGTNKTRVAVTGSNSYAVYNNSSATVTISGGLVDGTVASTVWNNAGGTITITNSSSDSVSNPYIRAKAGVAVMNNREGTININGGTVLAGFVDEDAGEEPAEEGSKGIAVYNASVGTINIKPNASNRLLITSSNPTTTEGTIYFTSTEGVAKSKLDINLGSTGTPFARIVNEGFGGNAIFQETHGYINIVIASNNSIGSNKTGMSNAGADLSDASGYALKVTNNDAKPYITLGSVTVPSTQEGRPTTNLSYGTLLGMVKGTDYAYAYNSSGTLQTGGIEERP